MKTNEFKLIFEFEGYSYFSKTSGKNTYHYKSKTANNRILNLIRIKAEEFYSTFNKKEFMHDNALNDTKKDKIGQLEEKETPIIEEEKQIEDNDY